jgi:hypothetical protein
LAISHYTPLPSQSFPTSDFLFPITLMPNLQFLNMADLALHPSPTHTMDCMREDSLYLKLSDIHNFESIAAIFSVLGGSTDITLTRCTMGDPGPFNADGKLTLRDIDADQNLVPLLHAWEGDTLQVINCPGFNDVVLDMMGKLSLWQRGIITGDSGLPQFLRSRLEASRRCQIE